MTEMIYLNDPRILNVPVRESGESLIDMRTVEALRIDPRLADSAGAYAHLRRSVVDRLVAAQALLPVKLRFLVVEGYRPMRLQQAYFAAHVARLEAAYPGQEATWYRERASRYISPHEVAPHVAGAAVDVTLCTVDGVEAWMGTEVNDTDTETCHTASTGISAEAKENRLIMNEALSAVGLVNYPTEWWHWSYGDRYWAYVTGASAARYGPV